MNQVVQIGLDFDTGTRNEPDPAHARLRHITGTRWGTKMYMDMKRLENRKETAA